MIKRGLFAVLAVLLLVGGMAASFGSTRAQDATPTSDKPLKVAFVYVGPIGDMGWTYAHDQGRLAIEEAYPNVETVYQESVPENPADAERVIRQFAQDGANIIVTTSFGYMDPTINVAKDFPDTVFIHISGYKTADNVGTAFGKIEEPRYVAGELAGKTTKSNQIGYVAAFPIPEVIRGINAFTLGVRHTNPDAVVKVVWTNTWFDPTTERQAADSLVSAGVDVLASGQDSPATGEAAKAADLPFVGYDSDQSENFPDNWLTASLYHWGPYYTERIKAVADGTWKTGSYYGNLADGFVSLAPYGKLVDDDTKAAIAKREDELKSGDFYEFTGPLTDQDGKVRVEDGEKLTLDDILSMDWFVDNVDGSPKG